MAATVLWTGKSVFPIPDSQKTVLTVTDEGVEIFIRKAFKKITSNLSFDRIAQVNISQGMMYSKIEIINQGGAGNIILENFNKADAETAKKIIEENIRLSVAALRGSKSDGQMSQADEIAKFAKLRDDGIITEDDFQVKKKALLGL
jgi:hypothetical protein